MIFLSPPPPLYGTIHTGKSENYECVVTRTSMVTISKIGNDGDEKKDRVMTLVTGVRFWGPVLNLVLNTKIGVPGLVAFCTR